MKNDGKETGFRGERLRQVREAKEIRQGELATLTGISIAQISRYENNLAIPTNKIIQKLSDAMGIQYSELAEISEKEVLSLEDFDRSVEKVKMLRETDIMAIKKVMDRFIYFYEVDSFLLEKSKFGS